MISSAFTNVEYFTEDAYSGVIRINSKKGDEVVITPKINLGDNMVSPVTFKLMTEDNKESNMFKINSSGKVHLSKDVSGNAVEGDSIKNKIIAVDSSNTEVEVELVIDVSNSIENYENDDDDTNEDDTSDKNNEDNTSDENDNNNNNQVSYSDMSNTMNSLLNKINKSISTMPEGFTNLPLANSNNISSNEDDDDDDVIEGFTNQKGGYYYL